ncbi:MAG: RnfABCDGE type electron transport complex subunit A [Oscillospiraceae bacterium]|nr:RnfABCDGE type electron transport complex subunit A [Oscillospiraceae bacterium]
MNLTGFISLSLGAILIENVIFSQFLGICPFMGVSKKMDSAVGMGIAVTFVLVLSSIVCWVVNRFLLVPLNIEYMQTVAFILVIASLVQFVELFLQKNIPSLYQSLGIYLPLITTNCAVLGIAIANIDRGYGLGSSIAYGLTSGIGFLLAIVLFASVREQMEVSSDFPKPFKGFPEAMLAGGLLALAFMGFSGLSVFG